MVDVVETNGISSNGLITVKITKDAKAALNFEGELTSVDDRDVQSSSWSFSSNAAYYILTTTRPITGGNKLSFGLGQHHRHDQLQCSIVRASESQTNTDVDKVEYFQQ